MDKILTIGDRIDVSLVKLEEGSLFTDEESIKQNRITSSLKRDKRVYISQLLDIVNYDTIYVAMPMDGITMVPLILMHEYSFCLYTKNGLYKGNGQVIERRKEDNIYYAIVKMTTSLKKFQRREYFRLEYVMNILFRVLEKREAKVIERRQVKKVDKLEQLLIEEENEAGLEWGEAILVDFSGGGARFITNVPLKLNYIIKIKIDFSEISQDNKNITLAAKVISSTAIINKNKAYENRVEFIGVKQKERDRIIKCIFEMQRKMRRRQL